MIELYGHPFAAFAWKPLIACYERQVPFVFKMVGPDHPENLKRIAELSPTGQFPAIVDGAREVTQSNAVVEYLDSQGDAPTLVPSNALEAIEARQMADIFDNYVNGFQQRVVADALRGEAEHDPRGVADAKESLKRSYAWLERWLLGREWAACGRFTLADVAAAPALFYADWVEPIARDQAALRAYRSRLLARPSIARVVDEARPYRSLYPLGAPDRD